MKKLKVGVLMGGKSRECEVSFNSGRTICDHIDTGYYDIIPIFQTAMGALFILPWSFLHRGKITDFQHRLHTEAQHIQWDELKHHIDIAYIAMHGRYAEDGILQGILELFSIPYIGSKIIASALGMDKIIQKKILHAAGIAVPQGIVIEPEHCNALHYIQEAFNNSTLSFPCIVKPHKEGSSLGVSVAHTLDELLIAVRNAAMVNEKTQAVIIEEKVVGMEFSCIVITDYTNGTLKALTPTEVVAHANVGFVDYEQKYMPGRAIQFTPARCTSAQQALIKTHAIAVMNVLGFTNMGRIDGFLLPDDTIVITDPNSFSGAAPSSYLFKQAAEDGINHTQLINHLIATEQAFLQKGNDAMPTLKPLPPLKKKLRVAVLLGGNSNEKEISLESGRNVVFKLSPYCYDSFPVFVSSTLRLYRIAPRLLVCSATQEIERQLDDTMEIKWHDLANLVDFVFIALHGGLGEGGGVQAMLEMLGIPYNGSSVLVSALCMDKYKTNCFLKSQGFDVPNGLLIEKNQWHENQNEWIKKIEQTLHFPCIIKPHDDGCSVLVKRIANAQECAAHLATLFVSKSHALVEELIQGMELTGGVIGNTHPHALPISQAVAARGILSIEEKFLPGAGENQTPAPLPAAALSLVQNTLQEVYRTIGCKGYARIDCFYQSATESPTQKERVIILEINTLPGLTPATCIFHQAAEIGMKPMEFIDKIIQLGLEEHGATKESSEMLVQNNEPSSPEAYI